MSADSTSAATPIEATTSSTAPVQVAAAIPAGPQVEASSPAAPAPRGRVTLKPLGRFVHGQGVATSAAEICAFDATSKRLFVVNVERQTIDVLDLSDPEHLALVGSLDVARYGVPTSVTCKGGIIAATVAPLSKHDRGTVVFLDASAQQIAAVEVGHEPDMLAFSPDGRWLVVVNEGEPEADYSFDPVGGISRIDVSQGVAAVTESSVITVGFEEFNDQRSELDSSIRIIGPNASVAQDLEPEYVAIAPDSQTAWLACQENNCIAIVDLQTPAVTRLVGLGFKDHSLPGNGLDASDKDDAINIRPWPVRGMYQPDGIACWSHNGATWLLTANDGKDRDTLGFSERARVADLALDPAVFPDAEELLGKKNLGRLRVSSATGDLNGDGKFEELHSFGGRSFAIWTADVEQVFDSGDQFEKIVAAELPDLFNSDHESHAFDDRSDDKGPEPEGVAIGQIGGSTYAFIGLERVGGVLVYDITDPAGPVFESYANPRDAAGDPAAGTGGDLGPEGVLFIRAEDSPNGRPLLVECYEVSGSTLVHEVVIAADAPN